MGRNKKKYFNQKPDENNKPKTDNGKTQQTQLSLAPSVKDDKNEDEECVYTPKRRPPAENTLTHEQVFLMMRLVEVPSHSNQTKEMRKFIRSELKKIPGVTFWTHDGNIYAIKGEAEVYPCVVAHTDTVHQMNDDVEALIAGDILYAMDIRDIKQVGTGGDDKVGIWMALQCLMKFPAMKVAFFRDEEIGCVGSKNAVMDFFKNVAFVMQCDRRGRYDFTDNISGTDMLNSEFKEAVKPLIEKHKRVYCTGMMTDVIALVRNGLEVCAANMSCGYYDPHTSRETINLLHMQETFNFLCDLISEAGNKRWLFPDRNKNHYSGNTFHSQKYDSPASPLYRGPTNFHERYGRYDSVDDSGNGSVGAVTVRTPGVDDWELRNGEWVRKTVTKTEKEPELTYHNEYGIDTTNKKFRTNISDYCENCGTLLDTESEKAIHHCEKCYKTATGDDLR